MIDARSLEKNSIEDRITHARNKVLVDLKTASALKDLSWLAELGKQKRYLENREEMAHDMLNGTLENKLTCIAEWW